MKDILIRKATIEDAEAIQSLIIELAVYEKAEEEVETNTETLKQWVFSEEAFAEVMIAEVDHKVVGFALYHLSYSTWKGKSLHLEDFVITESFREEGIGEALFLAVKQKAKNLACLRMDWQVLDWNTPAINFYKKQNATLEPGWLNGRFYKKDLND